MEMKELDADKDGLLSIQDLVNGACITEEIAREVMQKNDLNNDSCLNLKEYLLMFSGEDERCRAHRKFEQLLWQKFDGITESWKHGCRKWKAAPENVENTFQDIDDNDDGCITLDEIAGLVDVKTAFALFDVYDEDADGTLSYDEFNTMLCPESEELM